MYNFLPDNRVLFGAGEHGDVATLHGGGQQADHSRRVAHGIRTPGKHTFLGYYSYSTEVARCPLAMCNVQII